MNKVTALYSGTVKFLGPDGDKTGIFKVPIEIADIDVNGIIGDIQVDRRFHGGPEKALHQFAISSYQKIIEQFPNLSDAATAGSIGENINSDGLDDLQVFIGDIYKMGSAVIQVSQPRRPCWKINYKFDNGQLAKFITRQCISGWYYRVLEAGIARVGDSIELDYRDQKSISVNELMRITHQHRPDADELNMAIECPGLNLQWKANLQDRAAYLKENC